MKLIIQACLLINLISIQLAAFAQTPTPTFGKKEGQLHKYETAAGFDTDRDGAIYSAMNLNSGATIVKYSSAGAQVWKSVLTPTASYQDVEIKDLRVDTMRNVFVLAQSPINGRGTKMIIRKYTPKGLLLWEKIEQQRGYSYKPKQMRIDGYGNLMIAGEYNLPSDNPNYSNQKVFLAKHFGSNGNNAWMKVEYPPAIASAISFRGLTLDPSGNMIVILSDAANYAVAAGLVKYSRLGVFQWRKVIQPYVGDPTGAKKVATDNLGNAYVLLYRNSTGMGGGQHLMLAKYTPTGNLDWLRVFLNGMSATFDAAMTVAGDGSAYVSMTDGTASATFDKKDLIVKKISSANILLWTKTYSSGDSAIETPRDMEIDPAGSIYVVGSTKRRAYTGGDPYFEQTSRMLVLKYSTTGTLVWSVNTASPFVAVSNEGRRLRFQYATGKNPAFYVLGQTEYDTGPSYLADDIITLRYSTSALANNTLGAAAPAELPGLKIGSSLSAYPNPFRGTTTISFELPGTSMIKLTVYDVNGRLIRTMLHKQLSAGKHNVVFDGSIYAGQQLFYSLDSQGEAGTFNKTGSLSVMR